MSKTKKELIKLHVTLYSLLHPCNILAKLNGNQKLQKEIGQSQR